MMNIQNQTSHTEIEQPSSNALEQAALLKAQLAVARWRYAEQLISTTARRKNARERWLAALEHRLCDWIGRGGFTLEDGGAREQSTEKSCVD